MPSPRYYDLRDLRDDLSEALREWPHAKGEQEEQIAIEAVQDRVEEWLSENP